MGTYLVTGAAGFIGSKLAERLIMEGHEVIVIDNLSTGFRSCVPDQCGFIEGDCQDQKVIAQLTTYHFDAIFHVAGQSSGEISFDDPVYDLQTNAQSTLLLLDYACRSGCKKFVYASTMSVYGDENACPVSESAEIKPKSFYAVGKIASEHYMRIYSGRGINAVALRLNNVYGPGQNLENMRQGMASIFLAQAIKNGKIVVKGSPDRFRDFVYIDDVVDAFLAAGRSSEQFGIYNIATNHQTTVGELLNIIVSSMDAPVEVEFASGTPGDQFGIYCDYSRAQKHLGWSPRVALPDGIKKMVSWAKEAGAERE